jgi:hypothetical protein
VDVAARLIHELVAVPPIAARAGITVGVGCIAAHDDPAPLFMRPASAPAVLLSLLTEAPRTELTPALERIRAHSSRGCELGGKRYVHGYFEGWSAKDWESHYGPQRFAQFARDKRQYDPLGLLNAGCIRWE